MSCNGCRVLRKGCSEMCILRPCLQWIERPEAQGRATVFVAKFFGRAGLMSFISAVPESQDLSLLFEACGRTVNPVHGAIGLLWTGNWHVCQAAVETVLRGGTLRPMPELLAGGGGSPVQTSDDIFEAEITCTDMWMLRDPNSNSRFSTTRSRTSQKRKFTTDEPIKTAADHDLRLNPVFLAKVPPYKSYLPGSPSMNSEESVVTMTTCFESSLVNTHANEGEEKILNLFF